MDKAWKNEIYDGSNPVGPGGIVTSIGAVAPTLAAVLTLFASMIGFTSNTGANEKINPTFPLHKPVNLSNYGRFDHNPLLKSYSGSS